MSQEQIIDEDEIEFHPTDPKGKTLSAIKAYTIRSVPGLCFHQLSFGNLPENQAAMWSISHILSGGAIGMLVWNEKQGAIDYIVRYLSEIDWTMTIDEIKKDKSIIKIIAEADHDVKVRELIVETLNFN